MQNKLINWFQYLQNLSMSVSAQFPTTADALGANCAHSSIVDCEHSLLKFPGRSVQQTEWSTKKTSNYLQIDTYSGTPVLSLYYHNTAHSSLCISHSMLKWLFVVVVVNVVAVVIATSWGWQVNGRYAVVFNCRQWQLSPSSMLTSLIVIIVVIVVTKFFVRQTSDMSFGAVDSTTANMLFWGKANSYRVGNGTVGLGVAMLTSCRLLMVA